MAAFAKSTFSASLYAASRPTYPSQLFEHVFSYHRRAGGGRWERAVDLGCGSGQATRELVPHFHSVTGVDPSERMVKAAREEPGPRAEYIRGDAEDLRIEDGSVDLVIAAQAAHWFDWDKVWPETGRVLRKGGTAAFWVYSEFRLSAYPELTPVITEYAQGSGLGKYWQQPGRKILERMLVDVPDPSPQTGLGAVERVWFGMPSQPMGAEYPHTLHLPILMQKKMRWIDLLAYFRTWSALQTFHEKHPEDLQREPDMRFPADSHDDAKGGDIAIRFWNDLREGARAASGEVGVRDQVVVEWPLALILARRM